MIFDECKSHCSKKQVVIVSEENKMKHIAHNINYDTVYQFRIDGEIIPQNSQKKRCDYLLENETKKVVYLIELKGTNVEHAVDQIESTINIYRQKLSNYKILPRIIYKSNTHSIHSSKVLLFKRKHSDSKITTMVFEENI